MSNEDSRLIHNKTLSREAVGSIKTQSCLGKANITWTAGCKEQTLVGEQPCTQKQKLEHHRAGAGKNASGAPSQFKHPSKTVRVQSSVAGLLQAVETCSRRKSVADLHVSCSLPCCVRSHLSLHHLPAPPTDKLESQKLLT